MPERFLDLTDGVAMIVTDLHGDRDAFDRYVARFRQLLAEGQADRLILLGDLIHYYGPPARDGSLGMLLDVIALREELGAERVIMLLGNHEMPHLYGVTLSKGAQEFTPRFEHALGDHRAQVMSFLDGLPFYVRSAAGVVLSHAGPALDSVRQVEALRHFDHGAVLAEADAMLAQSDDLNGLYQSYQAMTGIPYEEAARRQLAINGPQDPRYPHLLRAFYISQRSREFQVLWDALFTGNEYGLTEAVYLQGCEAFLQAFSAEAPAPQQVIVSGHIATPGGHALLNRYHLRLNSAAHANPREAGRYLLVDLGQPVFSAMQLAGQLGSVFEPR